ncbi:MAG: hypothetical protein WCE30_03220 [Mycobacterium sp.]
MDGYSIIDEFISRYDSWRGIYVNAGRPARDEPVSEDGRLHLRAGYPYDGWTSYIMSDVPDGYEVLTATTERRNEPLESPVGFFSDAEDAGKYIIWSIGESLRISCRVDPVQWAWEDLGLDPRVRQVSLDKFVSRYELKANPARYFILRAGGTQPENRILSLTYDDLDAVLTSGIPGL